MARNRAIVLLDVDGVIASFRELLIRCSNEVNGTSFPSHPLDEEEYEFWDQIGLSEDQKNRARDAARRPGAALSLYPRPGAVVAVRELMHLHDVVFVTSPYPGSPTWAYEREQWLSSRFGDISPVSVISTSRKEFVVGDVFVDDKPDNVRKWQKVWPDSTAFLWLKSHESPEFVTTRDWERVKQAAWEAIR